MPLSSASLNCVLSWKLAQPNTGFQPTTQGSDSQSFNLAGLSLSTFNELLAATYSGIAASGKQTVDFFSFTDLVYQATGFLHALTFLVLPTGANAICTIQPGASNPINTIFRGTTPGIDVYPGGCFLLSQAPTATGYVIDSTHRNLDFVNNGSAAMGLTVVALGSTT